MSGMMPNEENSPHNNLPQDGRKDQSDSQGTTDPLSGQSFSGQSYSGRAVNASELRYILREPSEFQHLWQLLGDPQNTPQDQVVLSMPTDGQGVRVRVMVSPSNAHEFPDSVKFPFRGSLVDIPVEVRRIMDEPFGLQ